MRSAWPLLDYRNGAWLGGRVRALERLADLVAPDTRVVPADGRLMTGRDIVRQRDMFPLFSGANASNAVYRAYRIPYAWIPQLTRPKEERVTPPALGEFRVPR